MEKKNILIKKYKNYDFIATIDNPICYCHYDNIICFTCEYSSIFCSITNGCGICSPLITKPLYKVWNIDGDENSDSSSDDENENMCDIDMMLNMFKENLSEAKNLASLRVREILKNRNYG